MNVKTNLKKLNPIQNLHTPNKEHKLQSKLLYSCKKNKDISRNYKKAKLSDNSESKSNFITKVIAIHGKKNSERKFGYK